MAGSATGQQEQEDDEIHPGLVARYSDEQGVAVERVDRAISFVWESRPPDRRLGSGRFACRWNGLLMSQAPGRYQFFAYAAGHVQLKLNGESLFEGQSAKPNWFVSKPIELPFDYHRLEVAYRKTGDQARIALFWSGPQFQLEPLSPRQLYHEPDTTPDGRFERGASLSRALRCAACHDIPAETAPLAAPDLTRRLSGNIRPRWLVNHLSGPHAGTNSGEPLDGGTVATGNMPDFNLSRDDATAIAAFLLDKENPVTGDKPSGDADAGEKLFLTTGCLACHRVGQFGQHGLFDGGDLSHVADKRPVDLFARWLANPAKINAAHRMPTFQLSAKERNHLASFLATLGDGRQRPSETTAIARDRSLLTRGRSLLVEHRCSACHTTETPATSPIAKRTRLDGSSNWQLSCINRQQAGARRPHYRLAAADRDAIRQYISTIDRGPVEPVVDGLALMRENNCLACHQRDGSPGLAVKLPAIAKAHAELAPLLSAMTPPSLISVGDKLHDKALAEAIGRIGDVRRPWLAVRMPKFDFDDQQLQALVAYLVDADRIPELPAAKWTDPDGVVMRTAGPRLVTTEGFGCTSCHQIGKVMPFKAPLNTLGPDLSLLGKRIRRTWFERWVRNPARIVPRMEMPSVQLAVPGAMNNNLDRQLSAVWHILNQPDFQPPEPNPIRIVRRSGLPERRERAAVLTDVVESRGATFVKPLLIGLANRHNVLIDLENNRLAQWWIGDAARQRTRGKSWYWEAGGADLLQNGLVGSDLEIVWDGKPLAPMLVGQFPTRIDSWRHIDAGLEFRHRLRFACGDQKANHTIVVPVVQRITALAADSPSSRSGWRREIDIGRFDRATAIRLQVASTVSGAKVSDDRRSLLLAGGGQVRVDLIEPSNARFDDSCAVTVDVEGRNNRSLVLKLEYTSGLPVDRFPVIPPVADPPEPVALDVVPGYETIRLPIAAELMPTSLAWMNDGRLIVTSLKGRVWLGRDTDGDSLVDSLEPFSDELAAPFGAAGYDNYMDVINKYALLRLYDDDDDGKADRTVALAWGWGHTTDYHDWATGLPRDEQGNYYVAFPCQQDQRTLAGARLRGQVVKLVPRKPTAADPRHFDIEPLSGGHRFPIGIARSKQGALFVTDNQGNYNPFNELNHVRKGLRFGFINALERKEGFNPPLTPPAIDLPHPWTRSVNGICFLDTPPQLEARLGRSVFGPFEGHLIGCEYDTRRLIRMSLQRVGDTYQGAAYPFSLDRPSAGEALLGPLACAVSPEGDLYVGSIRDSGWGGANDIGTLARLRPKEGGLPAGIAEVRAVRDGFTIQFTKPVDADRAADADQYSVSSYTRVSTPAYGGDDVDRRVENISAIVVAPSARSVTVKLDELREGYVYEFRLKNLSGGDDLFHPAEAHYTLRRIPAR